MARYGYVGTNCGHTFELEFKMGSAPPIVNDSCCGGPADRNFGSDFSTILFRNDDPWRSYYLSGKGDKKAAERGVAIDERAPRNNDEFKRELSRGRRYVGDDTSTFGKLEREAIAESKALD